MRSAASRDTDVTKQNNLYIKLQHSSAASLFRTSLEIGQNLHSTAKLRMMFAQLQQFKKLNSILCIIRNTLLKICILPASPEVCYATPRGVATPGLGSPSLHYLVFGVYTVQCMSLFQNRDRDYLRVPLEQWFSTFFLSWPIFCCTKVLWPINFLSFLNEYSCSGADPESFDGGM